MLDSSSWWPVPVRTLFPLLWMKRPIGAAGSAVYEALLLKLPNHLTSPLSFKSHFSWDISTDRVDICMVLTCFYRELQVRGFRVSDHRSGLRFNICKLDTTGYFKGEFRDNFQTRSWWQALVILFKDLSILWSSAGVALLDISSCVGGDQNTFS